MSAWLHLVYANDVTGAFDPAKPRVAMRMLEDDPGLGTRDPYSACAVGDVQTLRAATRADPAWVNRPGGPFVLPPLVALTHSSLLQAPAFAERIREAARFLLASGADPNQSIGNRFPPASVATPDDGNRLSALYGAAGRNRDAALTALVLEAGADPNDGESLYHALESPACTRSLLQHGARIAGSNAMYRALDLAEPEALELLLAHGGDPNEAAANRPITDWGTPLLWAIRRGRSPRHVRALLGAGADPAARTPGGVGAYSLALQFGLIEVAQLLSEAGVAETLSDEAAFVAACAANDGVAARRIQAARPDLPAGLPQAALRALPDLVAAGRRDAAMLMVALGWPIAVPGGDWQASALNLAVFQGDAGLTEFLLAHGASWRERHGYGDDVCGTLSWASRNEAVENGDWVGCARALLAHGMPHAVTDGRRMRFSDEVAEVLINP